jgi:hypothetical protein
MEMREFSSTGIWDCAGVFERYFSVIFFSDEQEVRRKIHRIIIQVLEKKAVP